MRSESCSFIWHPIGAHDVAAGHGRQGYWRWRPRYRPGPCSPPFNQPTSYDIFRILYFVHILGAIAAFGPLFVYPRLQRLGDTTASPTPYAILMPALVVLWVPAWAWRAWRSSASAAMHWISITIVLWLIPPGGQLVPDPPVAHRRLRRGPKKSRPASASPT